MSALIDLHVHTTASDGTFSPSGVVALAKSLGLAAIGICDHDTADGIAEAMAAGAEAGLEVVPGIELSVDYRGYGIHILGYYIDPTAPALLELLDWVVMERERRNGQIAAAMAADGLGISLEYMHERFPDAIIGRPHFAAALAEKGYAESVADAFEKYLNRGGRYYRRREYIPMDRAFNALKRIGARPVFAHPLQYRFEQRELESLAALLKEKGAVGMECIYSVYTPEQTARLRALAGKLDMCVTGGSDFHGAGKPHIAMGSGTGNMRVPYELLAELKRR